MGVRLLRCFPPPSNWILENDFIRGFLLWDHSLSPAVETFSPSPVFSQKLPLQADSTRDYAPIIPGTIRDRGCTNSAGHSRQEIVPQLLAILIPDAFYSGIGDVQRPLNVSQAALFSQ